MHRVQLGYRRENREIGEENRRDTLALSRGARGVGHGGRRWRLRDSGGAVVLPVSTALTLIGRDVGGVAGGTVNLVMCVLAPHLYM